MHTDGGAHFFRCDFQVHTPRDNQWKGTSSAAPADRRRQAQDLVAACRSRDLHAIAVTDHHDFAFFPYVRAAALAEKDTDGALLPPVKRLVVFPGLELTLGQPTFQAILILDADFALDRLDDVLKALTVDPVDPTEARLPSVKPIDHIKSPLQLHDELDRHQWLKGRYILLPNVTDGGHKTMMRSGMGSAYREMPSIGGYLDGPVAKLGKGNLRIFAGEDSNYGNKSIALFQTSDSRSESFEELGRHSTWVKWTVPTAEALRQACLARESRISQTEPMLPSVSVTRLDVSNSRFLGPLAIDFNPQYNAVIGGRGTGKSTILSYLRWALCDEPHERPNDDESESGSVGARQRRLIEATLTALEAQVEVHFSINGLDHVVRRNSSSGEILLKVGADQFRQVREQDVRSLLPIHAYSQKQLSSVAVRVEELTRFVTAPIQARLDEIDERVADSQARLRENYATLQRLRSLGVSIERAELEIRSLEAQATTIRQSLGDLTDGDRDTLAAKPGHDEARDFARRSARRLREAEQSILNALEALQLLDAVQPDQSASWPSPIRQSALNVGELSGEAIGSSIDALRSALAELRASQLPGSDINEAQGEVDSLYAEFSHRYEQVKARSSAHDMKLAELAEVEGRARAAKELRDRHAADLARLGDPEATHHELRKELIDLAAERTTAISGECQTLSDLSDGLIRAHLQVGMGPIDERLRAAAAGSSIRGSRFEALFEAIAQESDPVATWNVVLDELEKMVRLDADAPIRSTDTPTLSRLQFPLADQERVKSRLTPDGWLDLALTNASDEPVFQYRVKEADYINFEDASAGQQATALLRVLLGQAGPPLVIDQPEDDLDSQVIRDVVDRIWTAKSRRQLIFSSHNANLVVNGDAELVVVCENRTQGDQSGGMIAAHGAIDVESIRVSITDVMEGGEKAFVLRKNKYGF